MRRGESKLGETERKKTEGSFQTKERHQDLSEKGEVQLKNAVDRKRFQEWGL